VPLFAVTPKGRLSVATDGRALDMGSGDETVIALVLRAEPTTDRASAKTSRSQ